MIGWYIHFPFKLTPSSICHLCSFPLYHFIPFHLCSQVFFFFFLIIRWDLMTTLSSWSFIRALCKVFERGTCKGLFKLFLFGFRRVLTCIKDIYVSPTGRDTHCDSASLLVLFASRQGMTCPPLTNLVNHKDGSRKCQHTHPFAPAQWHNGKYMLQ